MADQKRDVEEYVPDDDDDDDDCYVRAAEQAEQQQRRQELQPQQTAYGIAASQVNQTSTLTDPSFGQWGQQGEMHASLV